MLAIGQTRLLRWLTAHSAAYLITISARSSDIQQLVELTTLAAVRSTNSTIDYALILPSAVFSNKTWLTRQLVTGMSGGIIMQESIAAPSSTFIAADGDGYELAALWKSPVVP